MSFSSREFVPRDTVLFNDTICYNIHYGGPDAHRTRAHRAPIRHHCSVASAQDASDGRIYFPFTDGTRRE